MIYKVKRFSILEMATMTPVDYAKKKKEERENQQKEFGFLSGLFGGKKPIEISAKDLLTAYDKPEIKVDSQVFNDFPIPKSKLPKELQEYLTILKNEFPGEAKFTNPRTGDIMFGWDEVKKTTSRFIKNFGTRSPITILGKMNSGNYLAFFPKAQQIWVFDIAWGGYSQGLFGLGCGLKESIKIHLK